MDDNDDKFSTVSQDNTLFNTVTRKFLDFLTNLLD